MKHTYTTPAKDMGTTDVTTRKSGLVKKVVLTLGGIAGIGGLILGAKLIDNQAQFLGPDDFRNEIYASGFNNQDTSQVKKAIEFEGYTATPENVETYMDAGRMSSSTENAYDINGDGKVNGHGYKINGLN